MSATERLQEERTTARRGTAALMTALLAACIAFQLNASMLSPALVSMAHELDTDLSVIGLSQTWFFTAAALFSLFLPKLSDIVGRRKVLIGMMAAMGIGSLIAALAPDVTWLFVGRIVQGVSGPTVPLCLLMLRSSVTDPRKYGMLLGLVTAVNGGIAGIDSFAGGFMVEHFGFRSLFWTMVGFAALAAVLVAAFAPESRPGAGKRMDWVGVGLIVVAVGAALTALNKAAELVSGFAEGPLLTALGLAALAAAAFAGFWAVEKRAAAPMVEIVHLRQRATWAPLLTTVLTMTGIFAAINGIVPAYVQAVDPGFGIGPTEMSLIILTPYALLGWLTGPFAGRVAPVFGYGRVLRAGLGGSLLALALLAFFGLDSLPAMIAGTVLLGIAYAGTANIMLNGLGVVLSPPGNPGFLPGMNAGAFNLGAGLSFLALPAVLTGAGSAMGQHTAYLATLVFALVVTAVALAVSFLIPRPADAEVQR